MFTLPAIFMFAEYIFSVLVADTGIMQFECLHFKHILYGKIKS